MTLGIKQGLFYRKARLHCINLLLTYDKGCTARCAYCGLSNKRPGSYTGKSFIRVTWPTVALEDIIERISTRQDRVKRVCISMVTNRRAIEDTKNICRKLRSSFDIPVSLLIAPTLLDRSDLLDFKAVGADRIGVAIDLATAELFDRYRGSGIGGPHKWYAYWDCLADAIDIFGTRCAGSHFMVGMGETEVEMCRTMQTLQDMGGWTHLFSFFPEAESAMANHSPPPMEQYRRVQLARYIIDEGLSHMETFSFDAGGKITDFGIPRKELDRIIDSGEPFRTSGCPGYDGRVACNRPFANSRPGPDMRNYPFAPDENDIRRIRGQLGLASPAS